MLTNSGHRLWFSNITRERNEDWGDMYTLSQRFDVVYVNGPMEGVAEAEVVSNHNLMAGVDSLWLAPDNSIPFVPPSNAITLATAGGWPAVAAFNCGSGGVIALSDLGILGDSFAEGDNRQFWANLAEFAKAPP